MMKKFSPLRIISCCLLVLALTTANFGCKKAKQIIEEAWEGYWAGVFDLGEGWQVELDGERATFITAGLAKLGLKAGDPFMIGMVQTGNNTWRGYVRSQNGFGLLGIGDVQIIDNKLKITPDGGTAYALNKGVKSTGGTGGTGGGIAGTAQILLDQKVEGNLLDKKIFRITVPTGVKTMEIRTTEVAGTYYYNTADLFVRKGSDPVINRTPTYSWTADCASIESNRADEVCLFTNPASGQWNIVVYGYNTHFTSQLIVKIVK